MATPGPREIRLAVFQSVPDRVLNFDCRRQIARIA
jgi:hypothetical protein